MGCTFGIWVRRRVQVPEVEKACIREVFGVSLRMITERRRMREERGGDESTA